MCADCSTADVALGVVAFPLSHPVPDDLVDQLTGQSLHFPPQAAVSQPAWMHTVILLPAECIFVE